MAAMEGMRGEGQARECRPSLAMVTFYSGFVLSNRERHVS